MRYTELLKDELEILALFDGSNSQEGIKVHSAAGENAIAAAERLHGKGLLSQKDGGYLTSLGQTAVEHAEALLQILDVK